MLEVRSADFLIGVARCRQEPSRPCALGFVHGVEIVKDGGVYGLERLLRIGIVISFNFVAFISVRFVDSHLNKGGILKTELLQREVRLLNVLVIQRRQ